MISKFALWSSFVLGSRPEEEEGIATPPSLSLEPFGDFLETVLMTFFGDFFGEAFIGLTGEAWVLTGDFFSDALVSLAGDFFSDALVALVGFFSDALVSLAGDFFSLLALTGDCFSETLAALPGDFFSETTFIAFFGDEVGELFGVDFRDDFSQLVGSQSSSSSSSYSTIAGPLNLPFPWDSKSSLASSHPPRPSLLEEFDLGNGDDFLNSAILANNFWTPWSWAIT